MTRTGFAKKINTKALQCSLMEKEKRVKSLLVEGLEQAVCDNVRLHWSRNPSELLTQLARCVDTVAMIADRHGFSSSSTRQSGRGPSVRRNKIKECSQPFSALRNVEASSQAQAARTNDERQMSSAQQTNQVAYYRVVLVNDLILINCPVVRDPANQIR